MNLNYTIKRETWNCDDFKFLKSYLQHWASRTENPKIKGDVLIVDDEGVVTASRNYLKASVQIVGGREYLFNEGVLDWFVKGIKAILKKDVSRVLWFDFRDAVHNAMYETEDETYLLLDDGLNEIVRVKAKFGKSMYDLALTVGKRTYNVDELDNKFDGLIKNGLDWLESDYKDWRADNPEV